MLFFKILLQRNTVHTSLAIKQYINVTLMKVTPSVSLINTQRLKLALQKVINATETSQLVKLLILLLQMF